MKEYKKNFLLPRVKPYKAMAEIGMKIKKASLVKELTPPAIPARTTQDIFGRDADKYNKIRKHSKKNKKSVSGIIASV